MSNNSLPECLHPLFWEYDIATIETQLHGQLIMERIMERGSWAAMQWLRENFTLDSLRDFLKQRGKRVLPLRELNYWALICGVPGRTRRQWLVWREAKKSIWAQRHAS